jgi:SagB-type dehydrogenase family enzyme
MFPEDIRHIELPAVPGGGGRPLFDVLKARRSVRTYSGGPMPLEDVSRLLWAAQGVTRRLGRHLLRTAPSAGALYPVETYILANRVTGIPTGLYRYEAGEHRLAEKRSGNLGPALAAAALQQKMVAEAPLVFIWTMVPARSAWKYRERAFRYICLDAGHIAQNVALAAVSLGYGSCQIAAFIDEEVNGLMGLEPEEESAIYMTTVGVPLAVE